MNGKRAIILGLALLALPAGAAQAGGVFIGVGVPGPYYRGYYRPYYYGPRVYVGVPPVVVGVAPAGAVYYPPPPPGAVYAAPPPGTYYAAPPAGAA